MKAEVQQQNIVERSVATTDLSEGMAGYQRALSTLIANHSFNLNFLITIYYFSCLFYNG